MYSREILEQFSVSDLKELCHGFSLILSGNKTELFERIIAHQEAQAEKEQRMAYGAQAATLADGTPDSEFEAIIKKYIEWTKITSWDIYEGTGGSCYRKLDIREIRAEFKDYDPTLSPLRTNDELPFPQNKTEIFIDMIFEKLIDDQWEIFSPTKEEFDESQYDKFVEYMKNLTNIMKFPSEIETIINQYAKPASAMLRENWREGSSIIGILKQDNWWIDYRRRTLRWDGTRTWTWVDWCKFQRTIVPPARRRYLTFDDMIRHCRP